jgi:hypothetical protein
MKVGDLVRLKIGYTDECNDRLGVCGIIIGCDRRTVPPMITVLWDSGEPECIFEDEVEVINESM